MSTQDKADDAVVSELQAYCNRLGPQFLRNAAPLLNYVRELNGEIDRVFASLGEVLMKRDADIAADLSRRLGSPVDPAWISAHTLQAVDTLVGAIEESAAPAPLVGPSPGVSDATRPSPRTGRRHVRGGGGRG